MCKDLSIVQIHTCLFTWHTAVQHIEERQRLEDILSIEDLHPGPRIKISLCVFLVYFYLNALHWQQLKTAEQKKEEKK